MRGDIKGYESSNCKKHLTLLGLGDQQAQVGDGVCKGGFLLKSIKEYFMKISLELGLIKEKGRTIPRVAYNLANSNRLINIC